MAVIGACSCMPCPSDRSVGDCTRVYKRGARKLGKTSELLHVCAQPASTAVHFLIGSSIGAKYLAMPSVKALAFLPAQVFDK
jgi:hypothetical protein